MANTSACGSLILKDTDFKVITKNGSHIITDATAQTLGDIIYASCGLGLDGNFFKRLTNCISLSSATSATNVTASPCSGTLFDSAYFTLTGNVLSYNSGMNATLTFTTTPAGATISLVDGNNSAVSVSAGVANVILGRTYTYTVSNTGYVTQTGTIKIENVAETKTVTLVENP